MLLLEANDEFVKDASAIRNRIKKFGVKDVLSDDGEEIDIDYFITPEFDKDIYKLMRKYNLSGLYKTPLKWYFQLSKFPEIHKLKYPHHLIPELIPRFDYFEVETDEPGELKIERGNIYPYEGWEEEEHVMIEIFPETKLKDFVKNWKEISKKRDELYGNISKNAERTAKSENLKRDLEILRLKRQGGKAKEITKIINDNKNFNDIAYQDVSRIIKRLKERAKKNMPRKET